MSGQTVGIDVNGIFNAIAQAALEGLNETVKETEAAAKKHAPVRKIFGHQGQGRRGVPKGRNGIGFGKGAAGAAGYARWRRARAKNRRINIPAGDAQTDARLPSGPLYGHNNSFIPVMRYVDLPGTVTLTGNFRRYDRSGKQLTPRADAFEQVNKGPVRHKIVNPNELMNRQGRYEVASGRAAYREVKKARLVVDQASGKITRVPVRDRYGRLMTSDVETIGGTLRGEIFSTPAEQRGPFFWAYVISPVSYADDQEFGNRHNRAHPYLRPALYESRTRLREHVARAMAGLGRKAARKGSGLRPTRGA